jgi:HAD superfamily hydrolase (TIGR01490 family)
MSTNKPAALFDFDGTLARGDSIGPFMQYVFTRYPRSLIELPKIGFFAIPYGLGIVSKERMKTIVMKILNHVPQNKLEDLVQSFHQEIIQPRYFKQGLDRVNWHRNQGHTLVMASASVDTYMPLVQKDLGFDILVCTKTESNSSPVISGNNCFGQEKVVRLSQLDFFHKTDWANSWAYSDHHSDIPMMELCGNKVATGPTSKLRKHALVQGWQIVDWS